jgi:LuxR family maltose regulon positive regulatory protein
MAAFDSLVGLALTQQLMHLDDEAMETVGRLEAFAQELDESQYLSMVHSCYARISLLRGDLESAIERSRMILDKASPANLFMWLESPPITQARVLIAVCSEESLAKAIRLLRSIREMSETCRFTCQIIEIAVLQSLALEKQGRTDYALKALEEAVALAEPGGWIRPFVELGVPMADLLNNLRSQNIAIDYIGKILSAFSDIKTGASTIPVSSSPPSQVTPSPIPPVAKAPQSLVEPLTNRELEILEMLAQRLQNKEIAEKLFISPTTVKTHLQNIYQKLDAGNRREAVNNAKDLGIL